ncbi:MAG: outer membrane lipoprotein chaperone LolA [Halioglobus sp.]
MKRYFLALCLGLMPCLVHAQVGTDVDDLLAALKPIKHLQGSFTQRQYGQDNQLLAESSGKFRLLRPGYFAWEISSPDDQLIVAGPEFIWHHDRDLETVTRRPVTTDAEMTPLQILGGDETALREKFQVQRKAKGTYVLTPQSSDVGFKQLTLYLDKSRLTGMEIQDNLDQSVVIKFSDLDSTSKLTSADFAFTPPPGVDLFYYDE